MFTASSLDPGGGRVAQPVSTRHIVENPRNPIRNFISVPPYVREKCLQEYLSHKTPTEITIHHEKILENSGRILGILGTAPDLMV